MRILGKSSSPISSATFICCPLLFVWFRHCICKCMTSEGLENEILLKLFSQQMFNFFDWGKGKL